MRDRILGGGAYARSAFAMLGTTAKTAQNGAWIDRQASGKGLAMSAKLVVAYSVVLAAGESASLAASFQESVDGATSSGALGDAVASTQIANSVAGGTVTGTVEIDVSLASSKRYFRPVLTLSTSASGTVSYTAVAVLFGDQRQPASNAIASVAYPN